MKGGVGAGAPTEEEATCLVPVSADEWREEGSAGPLPSLVAPAAPRAPGSGSPLPLASSGRRQLRMGLLAVGGPDPFARAPWARRQSCRVRSRAL